MVEEDTDCIDVLTQIGAATKALQGVAVGFLDEHVRHCVVNAAADHDADAQAQAQAHEMVTEAMKAIERLIRS